MSLDIADHKYARMIVASHEFLQDSWTRAEASFKFRDGDQWDLATKSQIEAFGQCPSVINITFTMLNALAAIEESRQTDYSVVGNHEEDELIATPLSALLKNTLDQSELNYFISEGFKDGATGGLSFFEVHPEDDLDLDTKFVTVSLRHWNDYFYDPFASSGS
jgi:hypothetical protein